MGLDGKTWEPDARRQDPVLYSVPCLVILLIFVTVINMESRPKYEAVKQSPSRAIIISPPSPSSNVEKRLRGMQLGAKRCRCQSNLAVGEGGGARLRMLMRLVRGQVSGARKRFHM